MLSVHYLLQPGRFLTAGVVGGYDQFGSVVYYIDTFLLASCRSVSNFVPWPLNSVKALGHASMALHNNYSRSNLFSMYHFAIRSETTQFCEIFMKSKEVWSMIKRYFSRLICFFFDGDNCI